MSRQKKNYSAEFKAQVVLELLRGDTTLNELAERYQIAPATLSAWHRVFQERAQTFFQQGPTAQDKEITCQNVEIEALQKKVGQLTIECAPLRGQAGSKKNLTKSLAPTERTALVFRSETRICVKRQCELVEANRSSVYRRDKEEGKELSHGENAANLSLMRQLDELHMTYPAWGDRKLTAYLRNNGVPGLNGKRVRRLLRKMGIAALYPKPNLSRRLHAEYVRPYLLKGLTTVRPFVKTRKRKRSEWLLSLAVHSFDLRIGLKRRPRYTPAPVSDRQEPDAGGRHCNSQYTLQPRAAGLSHLRNL